MKSTVWILLFHIWFTFLPLRGARVQPASKLSSVSLSCLSPYLRRARGPISLLRLNWLGRPATWRKLGPTLWQSAVNKRLWPLNASLLTPGTSSGSLASTKEVLRSTALQLTSVIVVTVGCDGEPCQTLRLFFSGCSLADLKALWPQAWEPPSHLQQVHGQSNATCLDSSGFIQSLHWNSLPPVAVSGATSSNSRHWISELPANESPQITHRLP